MPRATPENVKLIEQFADQKWRLNNLYHITDKRGEKVRFIMNTAQENFYDNMALRNVILKARQRGFTTLIDLWLLDTCLFNSDQAAGIIAHSLDDAKVIFRTKIKYPYDNLPDGLKSARGATSDRVDELLLDNNSSIRVSTSYRSGTLQYLHVSEYGKISAKYPEKAKEIKTGAFEAVSKDGVIIIESTAEGSGGPFYEICKRAMHAKLEDRAQSPLDFKFHFYPWYENPEYTIEQKGLLLTAELEEYFDAVEARTGTTLTDGQRIWYSRKEETLKDEMFKEYPSTAEEAFAASIEGAYYAKEMARMRQDKRITSVPHDPSLPVNTFWDLGYDDSMTIIFHQQHGTQHRIIDYIESSHEGLPYYVSMLKDRANEHGYIYNSHILPHDAKQHSVNDGRSRVDTLHALGVRDTVVVRRVKNTDELLDDINWVRQFLRKAWIDERKCARLVECLDNYRKDWDDKMEAWKRTPRHDEYSHGADAMRTGARGLEETWDYMPGSLEPPTEPDF